MTQMIVCEIILHMLILPLLINRLRLSPPRVHEREPPFTKAICYSCHKRLCGEAGVAA